MRFSSAFRAALIAMTVSVFTIGAAYADSGRISFNVLKAGFVVGGSGGSGTLTFQGRRYPISIGGLSYGLHVRSVADEFCRHRLQHPPCL